MAVPEDQQSTLQLLSRTSQRLAESIDYESTLLTVAGMALPHLGSWCIVDVVEPGERMRRVGIVHPDPVKQEHARRLEWGWPPRGDHRLGAPQAVRSPVTEVIPHVSDEMLVAFADSEENLRDLRALGIGSVVVVPLRARGHVLGAITFVSANVGHQYVETDLELAEELAARCALARDNARIFRDGGGARASTERAAVVAVCNRNLPRRRGANRAGRGSWRRSATNHSHQRDRGVRGSAGDGDRRSDHCEAAGVYRPDPVQQSASDWTH
jgi:GAF domain-containing protein